MKRAFGAVGFVAAIACVLTVSRTPIQGQGKGNAEALHEGLLSVVRRGQSFYSRLSPPDSPTIADAKPGR